MQQRAQLQHTPGFNKELDRWFGVPGNEPMISGGSPFNGLGTLAVGVNRWLDFGLVEAVTRIKTVVVDITAALTSGAAQQATIQLFVSRSIFATAGTDPQPNVAGTQAATPFTSVGSAVASQFPTNPATNLNACQARGTPTNLGASSASLGPARFFFTPQDIPDLQWDFPVVGFEITAPAAFTGGTVTVFLELAST